MINDIYLSFVQYDVLYMNTNFVIAMLLMVSSCIQVYTRECKNTMLKCVMTKNGKYVRVVSLRRLNLKYTLLTLP